MFDGMDFSWVDTEGSMTCTIWRKDRTHPIVVTEYLSECRRGSDPWKMIHRMMRHKALMQCARYAFGFSGIYDEEEADDIVRGEIPRTVAATSREPTNAERFAHAVQAVTLAPPPDAPPVDLVDQPEPLAPVSPPESSAPHLDEPEPPSLGPLRDPRGQRQRYVRGRDGAGGGTRLSRRRGHEHPCPSLHPTVPARRPITHTP